MSNAIFATQRDVNGDALFDEQVVFVTPIATSMSVTSTLSPSIRDSLTYIRANLQARATATASLKNSVTYIATNMQVGGAMSATLKDSIVRIYSNMSVSSSLTAKLAQPAVLRTNLSVAPSLSAKLVVPIGLATQILVASSLSANLRTDVISNIPRGLRLVARPTGLDGTQLVRYRGDDYADEFAVLVEKTGEPININGCTFVMTVSQFKSPSATDPAVYQLFGQVTNAIDGIVEFDPTTLNTDLIGFYYYDVQMQDAAGVIRTLTSDSYVFKPDITH